MKANEFIHNGLYLIYDTSDTVVRYDITSNSFRSEWYEYPLALFYEDVCATEGDRYMFVKPIPLTEEILKANGIPTNGDTFCFDEDKSHTLELCYEDGCLLWTINVAEYCILYFEYVHELQHALSLCGLNELADNFKVE